MGYVKSWGLSVLVALGLVQQSAEPVKIGTTNITFVKGDITKQKVDAIVNAANEDLQNIGGVAGAISKAAGPELQLYCDKMPAVRNGKRCPTGSAVKTPAFEL